ncbi:MAG: 50S ribosome-binding GTPase [SAR324 cluster bacterium]|nr:50S ribosome-binding GTPase [SAR324 cluster bacterium]
MSINAPKGKGWFPGHMAKAKSALPSWIKNSNMIIEVRDARAPLVSGLLNLAQYQKKSLLVYNKRQLANPIINQKWQTHFENQFVDSMFCNFFVPQDIQKILRHLKKCASDQQLKKIRDDKLPWRVIVLGAPNTGKSTLINRLLARKRVQTGSLPGVTKRPEWVRINHRLELLDSPGIVSYDDTSEETRLILRLIYAFKEDLTETSESVEFLLQKLIDQPTKEFLNRYQLTNQLPEKPAELLQTILKQVNIRDKNPDNATIRATQKIVADFRAAKLGPISLESPPELI